ncbi:hypothetical protein ACFQ58_08615 [Agromyces sp. NPDC056523]|uniref:hypothetical protein n=1 Tax=Agromyces sp. NPDC056523 TaxID=3345850 RepID=UPI00366C393E
MNDLEDSIVRMSWDKTIRLGDLISSWVEHVGRLEADAFDYRSAFAWVADDLIGALYLRDILERALAAMEPADRARIQPRVLVADEVFISSTEDDVSGLVRAFAGRREQETDWWWGRVPREGRIRDELEE